MKGLLLKDFYVLKGFGRQYAMIIGFLAIFSFIMKDASMVSIYIVVISGTMVLSTFSVDEAVHFDRWVLTTPAGIKKLIGEKYLLFALLMGGGMLATAALNVISEMLWGGSAIAIQTGLSMTLLAFSTGYAVSLPAVFKMGIEKARYVYFAVLMGMAVCTGAWLKCFPQIAMLFSKVDPAVLAFINNPLVLILCAVGISTLLLVISYRVSLKMVRNKEW